MPTVTAHRLQGLLGSSLLRSPAYRGLADGLRLLIADGRVAAGTRLPSERELTEVLGVSRTTVTRAYDLLRQSGHLVSRRGSGSVVVLPGATAARLDPALVPGEVADAVNLTVASPPAPPGVAAAYRAAVERLPAHLGGSGYFPTGLPDLKEAIARRYDERGLPTDPEQVIVTSGALAASSVVARAALRTGDRVLAESPSYPNVLAGLARSGARLRALPVDRVAGWDAGVVREAVARVQPALTYLIPDFQNPTGHLMTDALRAELGAALDGTGTLTLVDETLAELTLDEPAAGLETPAPMAAHVRDCLTIGSASKTFWGGLRIGWIRAPHTRVAALLSSRLTQDLGAPPLEQLALLELLAWREEVLTVQRSRLRESRAALSAALSAALPQWRFLVPAGGLALWCELPEALSSALVLAAEPHGVLLAPGPVFAPAGGLERFVRVPYTLPPDVLVDAVDRIALAWDEARSRRGTARPRPALVM